MSSVVWAIKGFEFNSQVKSTIVSACEAEASLKKVCIGVSGYVAVRPAQARCERRVKRKMKMFLDVVS